jgi:ABC-type transporter Mla subunit MlaD
MSARVTRLKLVVLAAAAMAAGVAVVVGLGLRRGPTESYHVYFDESVQGLQVGAAVMYRGVDIGEVERITVAPDRRHVDVIVAIDHHEDERLGLASVAGALRARLAIQGVTGLKFIDIDLVGPSAPPLPALSFEPDPRHIRARPSLLEDLGADLAQVGDRLPVLLDRGATTLGKLDRFLDSAERLLASTEQQQLPAQAAQVLATAQLTLVDVRRLVAGIDRAAVPQHLGETLARVDGVLARVDGVVVDLGDTSLESSLELQRTLEDLGEAARTLHDLVDEIERDPDMLVKGRARSRRP